jgi:hypothetical protein
MLPYNDVIDNRQVNRHETNAPVHLHIREGRASAPQHKKETHKGSFFCTH